MREQLNIAVHTDGSVPKYLQLANALENWILREQLPIGERLPSSRQLARNLRMTVVTVNRGVRELQNRGVIERRIGSGTYVAGQRRSLRVGILCNTPIVPDFCYVSPMLHEIYNFWQRNHYDVLPLMREPRDYENTFAELNLAGAMVFDASAEGLEKIRELRGRNLPVVGFGVADPDHALELFGANERQIAIDEVRYLARLGHRRIGMLKLLTRTYNLDIREMDLIQGMWEVGLPFNPEWLILFPPGETLATNRHFRELMKRPDRPTALLLMQHHQILPLYDQLRELRLRIPEDVSVLGIDDPAYAALLTPPLTVVKQPVGDLTREACEQLLRMIENQPLAPKIKHQSIFVERGSCAPPPQETPTIVSNHL